MFLKHGTKNINEIELVAPTGFEPVFESRPIFTNELQELPAVQHPQRHATKTRCGFTREPPRCAPAPRNFGSGATVPVAASS
jgi:hypothetical protein